MVARRFTSLIDAFNGRRVVVLGDVIADEFIYGNLSRVSREAPVLILKYDSTQIIPGGAGNAANNVGALGGRANLVGIIGREESSRRLRSHLKPKVWSGRLVIELRERLESLLVVSILRDNRSYELIETHRQ